MRTIVEIKIKTLIDRLCKNGSSNQGTAKKDKGVFNKTQFGLDESGVFLLGNVRSNIDNFPIEL